MQGLASDCIQIIVQSRNYCNFDEITETVLVEESVITSKQDRYRAEGSTLSGEGPVGKWTTRATNALLGRKERHS